MSALADAIRRGRPRNELGSSSPLAGLHRRHARTVDVIAQSVAATAPAGVLLVQPGALYASSGSLAFLDVVLTVALVLMVALVIGMFARRLSSTGSLYTFAARGLGPHTGLVAGAALAVGCGAIAMNTQSSSATRFAQLITGSNAPPTLVVTLIVGIGALNIVLIAAGLRISTRILLVVEAVAVATVIALAIAALVVTGWDLSLLIPGPSDVSVEAIAAGIAFSLVGFVGFESGTSLGPETRRPLATVPRAILLSAGAVGVVMLVGTAAQLSIVAERPGAESLSAVTGYADLIDLIVAVSFLACSLAMTNAAARLVFTMSREGVLAPVLGRASRRGVPALAGAVLVVCVTIAPSVVLLAGGTRNDLRLLTSPASTVGFVVAYALLCVAAPVFLARIGELTARAAVLAIVPATGLACVLVIYAFRTASTNPLGLAGALLVIAMTAGAGMLRIRRHPLVAARIGMYDAPTDGDVIEGAGPR